MGVSLVPSYDDLVVKRGLHVLLYSGDVDGIVPTLATRRWLRKLQRMKLEDSWRPWRTSDGMLAGYTETYRPVNTTHTQNTSGRAVFATVLGAGHMVPRYQPFRAFTLIQNFISDSTTRVLEPQDVKVDRQPHLVHDAEAQYIELV